MANRPLILTGFMSAGKTTVAATVGELLQCRVVDLDDVVMANEGQTPKELIQQQGEPAFREIESRSLAQVLNGSDARVISLGGGTWIVERNRQLIEASRGISIWLDAPFDLCWSRIPAGGGDRPLAVEESEARKLYERRQPYYALAHFRIEIIEEKTIREIAEEIVALVRGNESSR